MTRCLRNKLKVTEMKYLCIIYLIAILFISCELNPFASSIETVVALSKGNVFYYNEYSLSEVVLADWYSYNEVIGDTVIQNKRYFVLNNNIFERADEYRVYTFRSDLEIVKLNYNIQIGDTVEFNNYRVIVENIEKKRVFNETQTVISVSSKKLNFQSIITGTYATKFGLLTFTQKIDNHTDGSTLVGVIIDGIQYGVIHR